MTAEGTRWTPKAIVCMGVSSFGGLGLAPVAPGTFGTLGGVLIAWLLSGTPNFLVSALVAALV
ncbi:phosphatidylglycerophosphatase A, partial [bacterium]|nr:phosphatidylglycerophosphatase A [bacterium]